MQKCMINMLHCALQRPEIEKNTMILKEIIKEINNCTLVDFMKKGR